MPRLRRSTLGCQLALFLLSTACKQQATEPAVVQPAPVQPSDPPPAPPATPEPEPLPVKDQPRIPAQAKTPTKPRTTAPKTPQASQTPQTKPNPPPVEAPEPEHSPVAAEPPPPAPPKPATRVSIPNTEHVRVEVPAGLQAWLDKDTRMQPWLAKVMKVIDGCYAGVRADNPNAAGTITFRVTMHENARPDPDIQSLPGQLSGVVACATGQLMRTRMPLFTGTEGESYVVRVKFE
jgi:hypothetical protein